MPIRYERIVLGSEENNSNTVEVPKLSGYMADRSNLC